MNIFLSNSTDIFAGGEDYVLILAKYLGKRGHRVWVSANPRHLLLAKCAMAGVATIPIEYVGMNRVFSVAGALRKHLQQNAIDIIHSNANYDRTCAALAAAFSRAGHVAGIHSAHSIQYNITHWLRNRWGIDHFIADADAVREVLVTKNGLPSSKITVISIGVESDPEDFRRRARAKTRAELGVSQDTVVIGNVARLVSFKGHTCLLEAIAEVVKQRANVLFPIIGDGELRNQLQQQARTLEIDPYVRFLGFRDNLHELYPGFDIYCHSSLELAAEAFPIAILRALATALPVICTNVGGIRLMVEEGKSGFLIPPEEPQALAAALLKAIGSAGLRTSMGDASFALFLREFHASAMAEKVERVYTAVLAGHRERGKQS